MNLQDLKRVTDEHGGSDRMPLLFVGHGNPMNAIEENRFSTSWQQIGHSLPRPKAILSVSAHWLTNGTRVLNVQRPETIHDFGGFPRELYEQQYPAPGAPEWAVETQKLAKKKHILLDDEWGFDHGTWSVLKKMFPGADIPVYQLSIDYRAPIREHYDLAQELRALREKGVLVLGSGNIVHNLPAVNFTDPRPYDWAKEFDEKISGWITGGDDMSIVEFQKLGRLASLAHPTYDHFLPLIYTLGFRHASEEPVFFNDGFEIGRAHV